MARSSFKTIYSYGTENGWVNGDTNYLEGNNGSLLLIIHFTQNDKINLTNSIIRMCELCNISS